MSETTASGAAPNATDFLRRFRDFLVGSSFMTEEQRQGILDDEESGVDTCSFCSAHGRGLKTCPITYCNENICYTCVAARKTFCVHCNHILCYTHLQPQGKGVYVCSSCTTWREAMRAQCND